MKKLKFLEYGWRLFIMQTLLHSLWPEVQKYIFAM